MNRIISLALATVAMQSLVIAMPANCAVAQDMRRITLEASAADTQFAQQHMIEVGDVPKHQLRIFEHRATFKNPPVINGIALKEQWTRGFTDLIDNNGSGKIYSVHQLENGDKFFSFSILVAHKAGSGFSTVAVGNITGGTGKLAGIRGMIRTLVTVDPQAGDSELVAKIEYAVDGDSGSHARAPAQVSDASNHRLSNARQAIAPISRAQGHLASSIRAPELQR